MMVGSNTHAPIVSATEALLTLFTLSLNRQTTHLLNNANAYITTVATNLIKRLVKHQITN
jgi:hypothetical protein